jgi:hypothetical protein
VTQTSVATVWEPQLVDRSLPGGLPWPTEDETPISSAAAQVLLSRGPTGVHLSDPWMAQPQLRLAGHFLVAPEAELAYRVVRFERVAGGIMVALIEFAPEHDPDIIHGLIAHAKDRLGIAWEPLLDVLSYPYRTFFTHRKAAILPAIPGIGGAVRTLASIADLDPSAARVLLSGRTDDVRRLLREANYSAVREIFDRIRRELAQQGVARFEPGLIVSEHLDAFRRITAEPDFAVAAQAIEGYTQRSGTLAADRMLATVELETALREARTGDGLEAQWDFLPVLNFAGMDALRARAQGFISSEAFSIETWRAFVAAEAARAWHGYNPLVLPPDSVEPAPARPTGRRRYRGPSFTERLSR